MKRQFKCSVHDVVDFVYASGDLVPAFTQKNAMQEGTKIHQQMASYYHEYESEVFLKTQGEFEDYTFEVQGRIDLYDKADDRIIEVKSTLHLDDDLELEHPNHFAQARFYGYMMFEQGKIEQEKELTISLLYVHKYTMKQKFVTKNYTFTELKDFFFETLRQYIEFKRMIDQFKEQKLESLKELNFPYPNYRKGQDLLISAVEEKVSQEEDLFVNAPTGIGKSLGTIYPSLKATSTPREQIFYLTAKGVVKGVADDSVQRLRDSSGLVAKSLVMTAKEKICINDEVRCNPEDCPFARNFYGKLKGALTDIFEHEDRFDESTIVKYAMKHELCPFEYQLSLSELSDLVICDYNYVFDPRVYLKRFFDIEKPQVTLLIDEAHNLYDRVTTMYTISIMPSLFLGIVEELDGEQKTIAKSCEKLVDKLMVYESMIEREGKSHLKFEDIDESILHEVALLIKKCDAYFDEKRERGEEISEELLSRYFELNNFMKISEFYSEDFIIWVEKQEEVRYQISCLNPKDLIKARTKQVRSTIFFSATLHPIDYFIYLCGGDENSHRLLIDSPFEQENLNLLVNTQISTKYKDRNFTKENIARAITQIVLTRGKYLIFFPSYQYLELVEPYLKDNLSENEVTIIKQERSMNERARRAFIEQFDTSEKHIVGLAVLGGSFAEGIDLQGDRLNGVAVVGVGLPTFDDYRRELQNYFNQQGVNGYQYAFTYPGFNKVLQAVGRVIRSERDLGIALLIDTRYLTREYLELFPNHWSHFRWL